MAYLDQVRYQVPVLVLVSDALFQNVVKAGDLKTKGTVGGMISHRLRGRSISPKAWQCAVSNTGESGPGLDKSRNTFPRPFKRDCNSIAISSVAPPGRNPLRILITEDFYAGGAVDFF